MFQTGLLSEYLTYKFGEIIY